ncbi:MAG: hypothetical protein WBV47_04490 [Salegentibacter sp.]
MKNYLLILFLFFGIGQSQAQNKDREAEKERIKALKTAFITQEMELNNQEAKKFWPIYDQYEAKRRDLFHREHIDFSNLSCMTAEEAEAQLQEFVEIEKEEYLLKKKLFADLKQIFTAKEIVKLQKLEDEFHRKLIREYRHKRQKQNSGNSK